MYRVLDFQKQSDYSIWQEKNEVERRESAFTSVVDLIHLFPANLPSWVPLSRQQQQHQQQNETFEIQK